VEHIATVIEAHNLFRHELVLFLQSLVFLRIANSPVLLLTTTGRRIGKQRTVPLLYLMDGRNVVLVASNLNQ
jgi:hypothetical protein